MLRKICVRTVLTGALIYATGCSSFDLKKGIPWGAGLNGEFSPPMKVMPVWTDTVMYHSGKAPVRGFGGRMFFHKEENGDPVKVKGTLEVYAFDEAGRAPNDSRPTRKYVFTPEQFQKHYSKSDIGHSYSVFIPWDEHGGDQKRITLITRFVPDSSPLVISQPSQQSLPGKPVMELAQQPPVPTRAFGAPGQAPLQPPAVWQQQQVAPAAQPGMPAQGMPVQQASYQQPMAQEPTLAAPPAEAPQMTTVTIPVRGQALGVMPRSHFAPGVPTANGSSDPAAQAPPQHATATAFGQTQHLQSANPPTLAPPHAARSAQERHRALGAPLTPLPRDRAQLQRPRVGWPSAPQGSPGQVPAIQSGSPLAATPTH
jgi:hypothetical protein